MSAGIIFGDVTYLCYVTFFDIQSVAFWTYQMRHGIMKA